MTILIKLVYYYLINRHILNHNFLTCAKAEIKGLTVCGKWRKNSKSRRDLELDQTMPNDRAIFISFKWIEHLCLSYCAHTHTHTHTHTRRLKSPVVANLSDIANYV